MGGVAVCQINRWTLFWLVKLVGIRLKIINLLQLIWSLLMFVVSPVTLSYLLWFHYLQIHLKGYVLVDGHLENMSEPWQVYFFSPENQQSVYGSLYKSPRSPCLCGICRFLLCSFQFCFAVSMLRSPLTTWMLFSFFSRVVVTACISNQPRASIVSQAGKSQYIKCLEW